MSAMACEIIGTGDGQLKNPSKSEGTVSKTIATDIVLEIIDSALDNADDTPDANEQKILDKIPEKHDISAAKEKSPLRGTGDQKSDEGFATQTYYDPVEGFSTQTYHPPVEKKNRLTDLVKNSKQILARIMMTDSKMAVNKEEKKEEEKLMEVIELDCVQISDLPFKSRSKILPEELPLPKNDSQDILAVPSTEEFMDEIEIGTLTSPMSGNKEAIEKKRMTFPRASGSRAKATFAAKCRTLKREANFLKKKKWDVSGRIVSFFRKKRQAVDTVTKSKDNQQCQEDLE